MATASGGLPYSVVDAFTPSPFGGNPAAVVVTATALPEALMQKIAMEMNLSETAFVVPDAGVDGSFSIRWFTPCKEVALCGHATLGAAHALFESGVPPHRLVFSSKSGPLHASLDAATKRIVMDFPEEAATASPAPDGLVRALRLPQDVSVSFTGRNRMDWLVEVTGGDAAIEALTPDFTALGEIDTRCVIVTSASSSGTHDFVSRVFAPAFGVNEDPVTGSAHCALAPYWCGRLGRESLCGRQASRRGGFVHVVCKGDARVGLAGDACTVAKGTLVGVRAY